jgi:hypothetical protein
MEHTVAEAANCSTPAQGSVLGGNIESKVTELDYDKKRPFELAAGAASVPVMWCKQIQRLAARGWNHGLLPPSEWRTIVIKLDEFGPP